MKKIVSLLLITFVSCFSATAQTAKTRRPALPSDLAAVAGKDSDSLLKNPVIQSRLKKLLGNKYDSFLESFETLNPITKKRNLLFSSGCLIHACTHAESAIAVDLANRTIHAAIFRQAEKTRYFNEGGKATPKVIRDWANNLRQINNQTNRSPSKLSFTGSARAHSVGHGPQLKEEKDEKTHAFVRDDHFAVRDHRGCSV